MIVGRHETICSDTALAEGMFAVGILKYPHPCLKKKCKNVERIDQEVIDRAAEMFQTMYEHSGVGLAAAQVGWDAQLFVVNITGEKDDEMVFVNPVVVETKGSVTEEEGCLSVPQAFGKVKRAEYIRVRAFDLEGQEFEVECDGLMARAVQHEIDHINGTLFVSKLSRAGKIAIAPKLKDLDERSQASHLKRT